MSDIYILLTPRTEITIYCIIILTVYISLVVDVECVSVVVCESFGFYKVFVYAHFIPQRVHLFFIAVKSLVRFPKTNMCFIFLTHSNDAIAASLEIFTLGRIGL